MATAHPQNDKLTTLLRSLHPSSSHFSLEFFPPKTQAGFTNLHSRLTRMVSALRPLFVTVTWGAGGSTATKSLELAEICQQQLGIPTVLHLTCTNGRQKVVDEALEACRSVGVRNILALRGDPPRDEYKDEDDTTREDTKQNSDEDEEEFTWAIDLVKYIKKKHGDYFCIGVAGYPEGHADESHPEAGKQNVDHDLPYLAEKIKAGADFIMTQLTFDLEAYSQYEEKLRCYVHPDGNKDIFRGVPIIPGLMPIQSYQIIKRITKLSHAKIPDEVARRIEEIKFDDELVKKIGVDILSEIVKSIQGLPRQEGLPRILHFYTLNLEKSVAFILERCSLIPKKTDPESRADDVFAVDASSDPELLRSRKQRRASSVNAQTHNRVILDRSRSTKSNSQISESAIEEVNGTNHETDEEGAGVPASEPTQDQHLRISEGQGSLGREATWDDFPNGRWGPSHSPAFGEIDGYGPSLKVGPITARRLWNHPKKREDVTELFRRHVLGELDAVPWSDEVDSEGTSSAAGGGGGGALRAETDVIRAELLRMIQDKGFWTLASQPAVDGVRSDDSVFGWGPKGEGFVFQKAFVEFFCTKTDWETLRQRLKDASALEYSWLKTDADNHFETSETDADDDVNTANTANTINSQQTLTAKMPRSTGVNAVTWGVFKGKEIATPTIIEAESFRAWGEEAYSIWGEWRRCFPRGSDEEKCLDLLKRESVLVNVVGQDFRGGHGGRGGGLWKILLGEDGRGSNGTEVNGVKGTNSTNKVNGVNGH